MDFNKEVLKKNSKCLDENMLRCKGCNTSRTLFNIKFNCTISYSRWRKTWKKYMEDGKSKFIISLLNFTRSFINE